MYSMVLMAALTTGTDIPDWGRRGGCCGCYGGWGGGYGGYGWGGWGRGGWGGWGRGGWGGYGGGWGGYGGGWGGGWGGWGYVAAPVFPPIYAAPTVLVSNPLPAATSVTRSMYYNPGTAGNRATITVHLPERASLIVDGKPTTSISNTRRFYSPPLEPGKSYHYTLTARMERDGKTVKAERRVDVTAGANRDITINMPDLDQSPEPVQSERPDARKPPAIDDR